MAWSAKFSCKHTGIRNERGMTLLEVIAALVLVTFLIGVLAEFLGNGVMLWGKNDRAYQRQDAAKTIYMTVYHDISTAYTGKFLSTEPVKGDEYHVNFWMETPKGLEQVGYRYDPSQKQIVRSVGFWGSTPAEKPLFTNITDWKFEYYQVSSKNWLLTWEPADQKQIPSLIRITVSMGGRTLGQWVIPIKTWHPDGDDEIKD